MKKSHHASAVPGVAESALRVTVRVGVFFDGTGNNRINSQIGSDCQALSELYKQAHIKECGGRHSDPNSSYSNALTNIARLADLYRQQPKAANTGNGLKVYHGLYVSGIGTTSGGRDSVFSGQGFGRGATGVVAKVERAVRKLNDSLKRFEQDNPGCVIAGLELDLFGFSRGAAAARHLANEVLKQRDGMLGPVLDPRSLPLSTDFSWGQKSVRLKVIGLFDTVAAIGAFCDLGNVRDAVNSRVNLYLPAGCAQQVLHLVAGDEFRRNFALNSVAPEWSREIVVPGAHSDVGGGYPLQMQERVSLIRPLRSVVRAQTPYDSTDAWLQAHVRLTTLDARRWIDPHDPYASVGVECMERQGSCGRGLKTVVSTVILERRVFGHLSLVYLHVMHGLACDEGVPFGPIDTSTTPGLPPELREVSGKLLNYARGCSPVHTDTQGQNSPGVRPEAQTHGLTPDEQQMLYRRYIHRSAHWNGPLGRRGVLMDSLFLHAPERHGRVRFTNVSQPGYPQ